MKRHNSILIFLIALLLPLSAQELPDAENAYNEGNYTKAVELYEQELEEGVSATLYYNLGNAYFKLNEMPSAILNYERALLLAPGDEDIRFNLTMARSRITDKIDPVESFFLVQWFTDLQNLQSSDGWAKTSIVFFILLVACLFLFFFGRFAILKKVGFFSGLIFILIIIMSNIFAFNQKSRLTNQEYAILFEPSVTVKSSPRPDGTDLFVLHEGVKLRIKNTLNNWCEIELEDGNVGWIPVSMIEKI